MNYKKSKSGNYKVELEQSFERRKFVYKPGHSITVKEAVLKEMIEADVVGSITPVD